MIMGMTLEELADHGELITSWESELVKQQLYDILKEASIANRVGRQIVDVINLRAGSSLDFVLADKDSMAFRRVAEGSTILVDPESYTKVNVEPVKYGTQALISMEVQEDANWDIVKRNLRQAGREAGVKEDDIIFTAFKDSTYGFPSETNHDYSSAGTEIAIADITGMMKLVEENDYKPNVMVLHPEQVNELRQIDTFVEADKLGSRATFETGFCGKIFGMDVLVTSTTNASTGFLLDSTEAGVLVVRRPLTMKTYEIPERDSLGAAITFRTEAKVLRPKAGCVLGVS